MFVTTNNTILIFGPKNHLNFLLSPFRPYASFLHSIKLEFTMKQSVIHLRTYFRDLHLSFILHMFFVFRKTWNFATTTKNEENYCLLQWDWERLNISKIVKLCLVLLSRILS